MQELVRNPGVVGNEKADECAVNKLWLDKAMACKI